MTTARRRIHFALSTLLLLVATLAIFAPSIDDEWHFDDEHEMQWPGVQSLKPQVSDAHYRGVLPLLLLGINSRISGEDGWSYHVLSMFLHFLNSVLVYTIAAALIPMMRRSNSGFGWFERGLPLLSALLFCVHPLATEPVVYIAQRSTLLAATFFLAALWIFVVARTSLTRGLRGLAFLALLLLFLQAGLHSKHVAATIPLVFFAFEWAFFRRLSRPNGIAIAMHAGAWALVLLRMGDFVARVLPGGEEGLLSGGDPPEDPAAIAGDSRMPSRMDYLLTQFRVIALYLRLTILPVGQNLDRDFRISHSWDPQVLASAALLAGLIVLAILLRRSLPVLSWGIAVYFLALLPTSSIVPSPDAVFEHRAYVSLAGFSWAALPAWERLLALRSRAFRAIPVLLILVLAVLSVQRVRVWDSELTLWSDVVQKSPNKGRPHVNLGLALQKAGRTEEAVAEYARAIQLDPANPLARINLGNIRRGEGNLGEAEALYREALALSPASATAHLDLGNVHADRGDWENAERFYRRALEHQPELADARYNLGKSFEARSLWNEAAAQYELAIQTRPADPKYHNDLGCVYHAMARWDDAERTLRRAIELAPEWAVPHYNLSLVHLARGDAQSASHELTKTLELDPSLHPARERLRQVSALAQATSSSSFRVNIEGLPPSAKLREVLEREAQDAEAHASNWFESPLQTPVTLEWATDSNELHRRGWNGSQTIAGLAVPSESRIVLFAPALASRPDRIRSVLLHEVVHLHVHASTRHADLSPPRWLDEGLAMWISGTWDLGFDWRANDSSLLTDAAAAGSLLSFEDLDASFPAGPFFALAYAQSHSFISWIVEHHGEDALRALLRELDRNRELDDAFEAATGRSFSNAEREWRRSIERRGPLSFLPSAQTLWVVGSVLVGVLMLIRFIQIRRRLAQADEAPEIEEA